MSRSRIVLPVPIVIDTREPIETAYEFNGFPTIRKKLYPGDYSLLGFEARVAVERKTKDDAYGCVGSGRDRFERSLADLSKIESPAVVIEADLADFALPPPYTKLNAAQAVGSYISWSVRWRIPVWFCHDRAMAERVVVRILASFLKHLAKEGRDD